MIMKLVQTAIPDVVVIEPAVFDDDRGWFMESFNEHRFHAELQKLGLPVPRAFVQDNHSFSHKGVVRGSALDVAVDIREGSPTFGQWVTEELSAANRRMLWIPEGFAHGFLALEDNTEFLYKTTDYYAKECERCIAWNDPDLAIAWPDMTDIKVSAKDAVGSTLGAADLFR